MAKTSQKSTGALWASFRFSVVGQLLSSPPARGGLKTAIRALAEKPWRHPVTDCEVQFAAVTIERWYYTARRQRDDPVSVSAPCAKIAARCRSPRCSPSGSISSTAIIRTGVTNCTTTISPRSWRPNLLSAACAVIPL